MDKYFLLISRRNALICVETFQMGLFKKFGPAIGYTVLKSFPLTGVYTAYFPVAARVDCSFEVFTAYISELLGSIGCGSLV